LSVDHDDRINTRWDHGSHGFQQREKRYPVI